MKGQSLIELIVAIAIFSISISVLIFFLLDSYIAGRLAFEMEKANFLAEEGMEAARSIRDNNWQDLTAGNHGLTIFGGHWIFQGAEEDISSELREGTRQVLIEDITLDRKKVTSMVNWQFSEGRPEEVKLISYLTNWQKIPLIEIRKPTRSTDLAKKTIHPARAYDYPDGGSWATTRYDTTADPSISFYGWQLPTQNYNSLVLKYRYHADGAIDDQYAVAYSTTGCGGVFTDLISPTSALASDTTISVNLSPSQDLAQLCLKIYSTMIGKSDRKNLYTRDVWIEGTY